MVKDRDDAFSIVPRPPSPPWPWDEEEELESGGLAWDQRTGPGALQRRDGGSQAVPAQADRSSWQRRLRAWPLAMGGGILGRLVGQGGVRGGWSEGVA